MQNTIYIEFGKMRVFLTSVSLIQKQVLCDARQENKTKVYSRNCIYSRLYSTVFVFSISKTA